MKIPDDAVYAVGDRFLVVTQGEFTQYSVYDAQYSLIDGGEYEGCLSPEAVVLDLSSDDPVLIPGEPRLLGDEESERVLDAIDEKGQEEIKQIQEDFER